MHDKTNHGADHVILVVEDERPLLSVIQQKLESQGFEVVTARSFVQAVEYLESIPSIDAVWLDHYLIGSKSGLDFVGHVRAKQEYQALPVFVVTNTGGHDKKETYMELGATDYFVKVNNRLDDIVQNIVGRLKEKTVKD